MSTIVTPAEAEAEIRALMDARVAAVKAKDAEALVANHSLDIVCYDLLDPLQYRGVGSVRKRAQQWFDGYEGPMGYEIEGLEVVAAFDVAFCYGLHHVTGTPRTARTSTCTGVRPRSSSASTEAGRSSTSTARCRST
jgi:ketosteroid isomerase-like protein